MATEKKRSQLEALDPTRKVEKVRTFIRIPKPVKDDAIRQVKQLKMKSLNNLIVHALIEYLKKAA